MRHDEVKKGLLVRLLIDYANVPAATCATVDALETMTDGTWWFTVRWRPYTPIPHKFPRQVMEYSLNLWEADLALFEAVSAEEEQQGRRSQVDASSSPILAAHPTLGGGWQARRRGRVPPNQLSLFRADDL
jgi:hypothetical protein